MTWLTDFYKFFKDKFGGIFKFFGIELPEINLDVMIDIAIAFTNEIVGITFGGKLGPLQGGLTCLYRLSDGVLSCGGGQVNLFTIIQEIKEKVEWVIHKAKEFFQQLEVVLRAGFDEVGKWFVKIFSGKGKPIHTCPPNKEQNGLLCYDRCRDGYHGIANICWRNLIGCPSGFRDDGLFCAKPADWCNFWAWEHANCGSSGHNTIYSCCTYNCPSGTTDIGVSCAKSTDSYFRDIGSPLGCAPDEEFYSGLCFKKNAKLFLERNLNEKQSKKGTNNKVVNNKEQKPEVIIIPPTIIPKITKEKPKQCHDYKDVKSCRDHPNCIWKGTVDIQTKKKIEKCLVNLRRLVHKPSQKGYLNLVSGSNNIKKITPIFNKTRDFKKELDVLKNSGKDKNGKPNRFA
jgi:hypothetical protein